MIGNGCTDVTECTLASNYYPFHFLNYIGGQNMISPQLYKELMNNLQCYDDESTYCDNLINRFYLQFVVEYDEDEDEYDYKYIDNYDIYGYTGPCPSE